VWGETLRQDSSLTGRKGKEKKVSGKLWEKQEKVNRVSSISRSLFLSKNPMTKSILSKEEERGGCSCRDKGNPCPSDSGRGRLLGAGSITRKVREIEKKKKQQEAEDQVREQSDRQLSRRTHEGLEGEGRNAGGKGWQQRAS